LLIEEGIFIFSFEFVPSAFDFDFKYEFLKGTDNQEKMTCVLCVPVYYLDSGHKCISFIDKIQTIQNCRRHSFSIGNISFYFNYFGHTGFTINLESENRRSFYDYNYYNGIVTNIINPINTNCTSCEDGYFVNDKGECEIDTYMVSDMCQALERDHIFDELKDKKLMQVRKAKKGEILPTIYMEGKESSKFDPDFFIVNVAHGVPSDKKNQNIIQTYDFPVSSRAPKGIVTSNMIKDYFKKYKSVDPNIRCANLNFLIYVAKTVDIETASTFAKQVLDKKINWEVVETLLSNYIGY